MIRFRRLFEIHLSDRNVSADELHDFVEDFLGRMKARKADATHGVLYTTIGNTVLPLFTAFDSALGRRATLLGEQEGGTISKDDALRLIRTRVRQREGRVRDAFDRGSAGYEEFFPRGMSEVSRATLAQVPAMMDRLIGAADKYAAKVGAELAVEFRALKETFTNARGEQVDSKGDVTEARAAVAAARAALEFATSAALLDLAKAHLGHPERAEDLFNQSLLDDPTRSQADDEKPTPPTA